MSDFKIQDIFVMFIIIYPNNLKNSVCLYFSIFAIMKLFLNNLVFILDSNPECSPLQLSVGQLLLC